MNETSQLASASMTFSEEVPADGVTGGNAVVDTSTGEIISELNYHVRRAPDGGAAGQLAYADAGHGTVVYLDQSDSDHLLRIVNGKTGDQWDLAIPENADPNLARYKMSPNGACLLLTVDEQTGVDDDRILTEHVGSWIAPLKPEAEWTKLDVPVVDWWQVADDGDIQTLPAQDFATPAVEASSSEMFIVGEDTVTSDLATDSAVGTIDGDGLTLPLANGESVTIPDVVRIDDIGEPGFALVTRADESRAVIDLRSGTSVAEVPADVQYERSFGSLLFVPDDDDLTDWKITDLRNGDTRLLSDIIELPTDTGVQPLVSETHGDSLIVRLTLGTMTDSGLEDIASDGAFVIAGSLDRAVPCRCRTLWTSRRLPRTCRWCRAPTLQSLRTAPRLRTTEFWSSTPAPATSLPGSALTRSAMIRRWSGSPMTAD